MTKRAAPQALAGRCIWLTRPESQCQALKAELVALGAAVVCLPLLDIHPCPLTRADRQKLVDLDRYDLVFYVSTNAARIGLAAIGQWWPQYPAHIRNFAVGPGTAAVLEAEGLRAYYPNERMTSEAMLALPQLQDIAGQRALIVRGVGGREIIAEGLLARGAEVDYAELYERRRPAHDADWLKALITRQPPGAVVISSGEALDNLKALYAPLTPQWQGLPLLVSSPRLAEHAEGLGFRQAAVMAGANDASILAGVLASCAAVE